MNDLDMLLSERLRRGALPVAEAMRFAAELADALRQNHDRGVVYGILEPARVSLTPSGARLVDPGSETSPRGGRGVSPYTAPEQLQGKADSQSDVFAFGALLYEMLSGRTAFSGDSDEALKAAILEKEPPPLTAGGELAGALNRLVMNCLAKPPHRRWQRMQKVQMELKLLSTQARRSQRPAVSVGAEAMLRADIAELEKRLLARIHAVEGAIEPVAPVHARIGEMEKGLHARLDEMAGRIEQVAPVRAQIAEVEKTLQARIEPLEGRIGEQTRSIESLQSAIAQTDDLVGRVVDAFERFQESMLDPAQEEHAGIAVSEVS